MVKRKKVCKNSCQKETKLFNNIKLLFDTYRQKLGQFAENKRNNILTKVENSSISALIVKWVFTNKISIILFIMLLIYGSRYYYIENQYLLEKNKSLLQEVDLYLQKTKELRAKIDSLREESGKAKKETEKIKEKIKNFTADEKKKILLEYVVRLKRIRGL